MHIGTILKDCTLSICRYVNRLDNVGHSRPRKIILRGPSEFYQCALLFSCRLTILAGCPSGSKLFNFKSSFVKCSLSFSLYVTNFFKILGYSLQTKWEKRTVYSSSSGSFSKYGSGLFSVL